MKIDRADTVVHPTLTVAKLSCASVGMALPRTERAVVQPLKQE
jgi:hypothetical protein